VYSLDFLRTQQSTSSISADQALGMGVLGNVCGAMMAPFSGYLCDRVGVGKMFLMGQVRYWLSLSLPTGFPLASAYINEFF
jgi:MFS family permease